MALVQEQCPNCGIPISVHVGQFSDSPRFLWHKSYDCPFCNRRLEADGSDELDEASRQAILAQEGRWSVYIDESGPKAILAAQTLREAIGLSLSDAAAIIRALPAIVAEGTKAEMERMQSLLSLRNLKSDVRRMADN